ncbi:phasin family protein [Actinoplanes sp. CA-030573]|uniref:phasin family protein n=1 Tax=Actinoplanes sp. CA-030573 TaxID=3239898 RepID=UPI003D91C66F
MPDAWRAYLEMALGLTETPRKRAQKAVGDLVNRGGATAAQLQGLVDDLLSAGMANREALTNIVRYEVDRALGVVGLATAEEVTELTSRVRELEKQLRDEREKVAKGDGAPEAEVGGTRLDKPAPAPRKVAKKAVAKKAVKATPNAMPAAGTTPATPAGNAPAPTPSSAPAAAAAPAPSPVSAPAKAAAKKAAKKAGPPAPDTLSAPIAEALSTPEVEALAATASEASPAAARKAPAKKVSPAKKSAPVKKSAPAKKAAKKAAPSTEPEA